MQYSKIKAAAPTGQASSEAGGIGEGKVKPPYELSSGNNCTMTKSTAVEDMSELSGDDRRHELSAEQMFATNHGTMENTYTVASFAGYILHLDLITTGMERVSESL